MKKISFWYEFASTYSYLSVMRIEKLAKERKINIEWKPFLLGPIFKKQGLNDSPFNIFKLKGNYMWRDLKRLCTQRNLAFKKPDIFPQNGLLAARIALAGIKEGWCAEFSKQVFKANFAENKNISEPQVLQRILESMNLNFDEVMKNALADSNKQALRDQNTEAEKLGIFGAPSFTVGKELFWGDDRLEMAFENLEAIKIKRNLVSKLIALCRRHRQERRHL